MTRQSTTEYTDYLLRAMHEGRFRSPLLLLHSGRFDSRWSREAHWGRARIWYRYSADGHSSLIAENDDTENYHEDYDWNRFPRKMIDRVQFSHNLWSDLRAVLEVIGGIWVGYFSYDLCRSIEPGKLGNHRTAHDWPLVELGRIDFHALTTPPDHHLLETDSIGHKREKPFAIDSEDESVLDSDLSRDEYGPAVVKILEHIRAGDVYQVNLSRRLTTEYAGHPRELFCRLATQSPAWYGAYLELPNGRHILSNSPELFLRLEDGKVTTRPIKGTLPASEHWTKLLQSEKDKAELNMIVDQMRNDLGRVCSYGTVQVTETRKIETHPTIHHGVATIEGQLHESKDVVDLLRATLPAGSITGAPKIRAMQIIDELEPTSRGPIYGAIGMISKNSLNLNVAIRSMLLTPICKDHHRVEFRVGGGIVADSDPAAEYEETLDKAQAMLCALHASRSRIYTPG